ncbi:hypothetical protein DFH29DRAFT_918421 [Suillus ampliporus]|nr:hypothetical protein DFH29DRAFT_918421 [Suillus ampliporus]
MYGFKRGHNLRHNILAESPSIPTLALVWLVGRMTGSKVVIDWHNFRYSILALKLGELQNDLKSYSVVLCTLTFSLPTLWETIWCKNADQLDTRRSCTIVHPATFISVHL